MRAEIRLAVLLFRARRTAMLLMLLLTLVFQAATVSAEIIPLQFWTTEVHPRRMAVINYLSRVFMLFNPDIAIRVQGVEENLMAGAITKAVASHTQPDIISCCSDIIVALSQKGWMDNTNAASIIASVGRERFYTGALNKLLLPDGTFCGVPYNGWIQGIWYRKDWFREYNLAPPDSWTHIIRAAQTLHSPEAGRYGILIGTRADVYAEQVFTHLALSVNAEEFNPEGKVVFDSPATLKTLQFYKKLARYTPPGPQWWRGRDYYLQGKLAMMFYSTFIMDDLAVPSVAADSLTSKNFSNLNGTAFDQTLLNNTGVVTTIHGTRTAGYGVIHALGLLRTTDSRKQAALARFVRFLFSKEAYISWLHMDPGGMLPVLKDIASSDIFTRDLQGVFHQYSRQRIRSIIAGFEALRSFSFVEGQLIPEAAQVAAAGILPRMIHNTLQKGMSPKQALALAALQMRELERRKEPPSPRPLF